MSANAAPPNVVSDSRVEEGDILDKGHKSNGIGTKILRVIWDNDDKTVEERKFVHKLDACMMTIAMLSYFVKYFSQANISNAYATGMDEDLNFTGDQYNILLTMFTVGTVIGTFPGTLMMVWFRPSIWLPCCEVIWTILCMCCAAAKNPQTLYGLRFFIGLLEATAYPGMVWVLGSWYGPSELGKRVIMFQATSSVGTMFSGYIQAAVHAGLDGVGGILGWQWLMLMDGVICMPICVAGFFFIPDVPSNINPRLKWYFKEKDVAMAQARTQRWKRAPAKALNLQSIKSIYSTWIPWVFFVPYTAFVIGLGSYLYMNLWLRSTDNFNTATLINVIPTGGYAISIFMSLVYSWTSDAMGMRWPILLIGGLPPLIGNIILSVWPAATSAKFAGFFLNFTATPIGAILMAWANEILSESAESRAIVTGSMNTIAYTFNAFAPNLIWPASEAPVYSAGYKVGIGLFSVWIVGIFVIMYLQRYHPVTKYQLAYKDDQQHIRGNVEQYDEDVKRESTEGVAVPPAVPIVPIIDGTATRQ